MFFSPQKGHAMRRWCRVAVLCALCALCPPRAGDVARWASGGVVVRSGRAAAGASGNEIAEEVRSGSEAAVLSSPALSVVSEVASAIEEEVASAIEPEIEPMLEQ